MRYLDNLKPSRIGFVPSRAHQPFNQAQQNTADPCKRAGRRNARATNKMEFAFQNFGSPPHNKNCTPVMSVSDREQICTLTKPGEPITRSFESGI